MPTETWGERVADDYNSRTEDANLVAVAPTTNYGSAVDMYAGYLSADIWHPIIRFKPNQDIAGAIVDSATLWLNCNFVQYGTHTLSVYRVLQNWIEGEVTWNRFSTATAWNTAGALAANDAGDDDGIYDTLATPEGTMVVATTGWDSIDITSLVQGWVDGTKDENGVMLISDYTTGDWHTIQGQAGNATEGNRPYLSIEYHYIVGPANLNKILTVPTANVSKINGVAIANIAKVNTVA